MVQSIVLCAQKTLSTQGNYLDVCVYSVRKKAEVWNSSLRNFSHLSFKGRRAPNWTLLVLSWPFWALSFRIWPFRLWRVLLWFHNLPQKRAHAAAGTLIYMIQTFPVYAIHKANARVHANYCLPNLKSHSRRWEPQLQICFSCEEETLKSDSKERAELKRMCLNDSKAILIPPDILSLTHPPRSEMKQHNTVEAAISAN